MKRVEGLSSLAIAATLALAAPASATMTDFAYYQPVGTASNIKFASTNQFGTAKNNGAFAGVTVKFGFLSPYLVDLGGINATFTLLSKTSDTVHTLSTTRYESSLQGSFSFISTQAFTTSFGVHYGVGTNLLSGTFSKAVLAGTLNGTTASFSDSSGAGGAITYTSDVLDFDQTTARDLSLTFVSMSPKLTVGATNHLFSAFKGSSNGEFSSDDAPMVVGVPEPASWTLALAGFGLIGFALRRRRAEALFA
jgi:hypothetical protein